MAWLMEPETVLERVVDDPKAPVRDRVEALRMLEHPPLLLLRRLLVQPVPHMQHSPRPPEKPVPPKLRSLAALKYAREVRFRQDRARAKAKSPGAHLANADADTGNPLGV